jgi:nitrogen-specific signal transduction histidine kinase
MISAEVVLTFTTGVSLVLGFLVFAANHRRTTNQAFLILTATIAGWLTSVNLVFGSTTPETAADFIRVASLIGGFLPVAISLVRFSVVQPDLSLAGILRAIPLRLGFYTGIAIYCLTPFYLLGAELPPEGVPNAVYGQASLLYPVYFVSSLIWVSRELMRDLSRSVGIMRVEVEFVLAGVLCLLGAGLFAGVLPLIVRNSQIVGFAPLWFVAMNAILAYGISTRRILSVGTLIRRSISYGLLGTYLIIVYSGGWWIAASLLPLFAIDPGYLAPLTGALAAALSMGRAESFLQAFVRRIFINVHEVNLRATLKAAEQLLTHISTTDDLLKKFVSLMSQTAGTDFVAVAVMGAERKSYVWPTGEDDSVLPDLGLLEYLSEYPFTLSSATAPRRRQQPGLEMALERLRASGGVIALPIVSHRVLSGVIILGPKLSGRVYDAADEEALELLTQRLAVALENAELYTEQRRSKQYLESLLTELTSGVVAVDSHGVVTVCNRQAERILRISATELVGQHCSALHPIFAEILIAGLQSADGVREASASVRFGEDEPVPFRYSTQHIGEADRGLILVFDDLSQIKSLEQQLRRSDRLAVLGTMSAGLAHEIRNPLVPIKTFVSLIPERLDDPEFLLRFAEIGRAHIERIERLVTQLLSFSRSRAPQRESVSVHQMLETTVALLGHDLARRGIDLEADLIARSDAVYADRQQLEQVLLNILMNAIDAMPGGGKLIVSTRLHCESLQVISRSMLQIQVADTGPGIPEHLLPKVFDPFVTTKSSGTGLGLSIAYGIVADHKGTIEIRNSAHGVVVLLNLPISAEEEMAA